MINSTLKQGVTGYMANGLIICPLIEGTSGKGVLKGKRVPVLVVVEKKGWTSSPQCIIKESIKRKILPPRGKNYRPGVGRMKRFR